MVERAFGSLRREVDELLADRPAQPARQAGADVFASDPKVLLGSLLKIKEGESAEGGGRFATVRVHQGHRIDQDVVQLKVSLAGSGSAGSCVWMGPDELSKRVEAAVVGIMADSKKAESKRGKSAATVGDAVLSAVEKEGGVEELRAVTMVGGVQYERILTVEAAVLEFGLRWLPWQGEVQEDAEAPAPSYGALVPEAFYAAYEVEQGGAGGLGQGDVDESVRRSGVLARLGLLCGLRSLAMSGLQVGELCASAVVLVGGVQYERILTVEAAVSEFGLRWLPWQGEVQEAAEAPAPSYGALVPERSHPVA